jgi:hypothetical protein
MLRKLKWQLPGEPLAARYNWWQGPVPVRGPTVEKHWSKVYTCLGTDATLIVVPLWLKFLIKYVYKPSMLPSNNKGGPVFPVADIVRPAWWRHLRGSWLTRSSLLARSIPQHVATARETTVSSRTPYWTLSVILRPFSKTDVFLARVGVSTVYWIPSEQELVW